MIDENDRHFGRAVLLIKALYAPKMPKIFMSQRWHKNVICFFEFHGPSSFAGQHMRKEKHTVTLFDVSVHKQGFLPPKDFIKLFEDLGIPKVLYRGRANKTFIDSVRNNTLPGMTLEGVVCKAPNPKKKKTGKPVMFKIKSLAWLDKLKNFCGEDAKKFDLLR